MHRMEGGRYSRADKIALRAELHKALRNTLAIALLVRRCYTIRVCLIKCMESFKTQKGNFNEEIVAFGCYGVLCGWL
jgi:hypothetical protein